MPWYYAKDNQRMGPFTDQEFSGMVSQGTIAQDALVWRDGMANWLPLYEVQAQLSGGAAPAATPGIPELSDKALVVCSSCHRAFPEDEVIQYQGAYICAQCKPVFVQQLREGAQISGVLNYAGFWIRFAAYFIDSIIMGIFNFILGAIVGFGMAVTGGQGDTAMMIMQVGLWVIQMAVGITYFTYFNGKFGATPGKMACGLRIVTAEGQPISYGRACGRYFALMLSGLTLMIGFIIAAFDSEKRALHDHICGTRVIRK